MFSQIPSLSFPFTPFPLGHSRSLWICFCLLNKFLCIIIQILHLVIVYDVLSLSDLAQDCQEELLVRLGLGLLDKVWTQKR